MYTTLQRLERDGLIESDGGDGDGPQKRFRITAEGERELAGWLRTPPDLSAPPRDEVVMKVLVALGMPGTDAHEIIQAHRRYLVELRRQWTRVKDSEAENDLSLALAVDAELFRLECPAARLPSAVLAWWLGSVAVFGAGVSLFDDLVYGGPLMSGYRPGRSSSASARCSRTSGI